MCLGFVSTAINPCFAGLKITVGYLKKKKKNRKTNNPFERKGASCYEELCKLNFNASNIHFLKNTIHKAENNPLFFNCSHQLELTNVWNKSENNIQNVSNSRSIVLLTLEHRENILSNPTELKENHF